MGNLITYSQLNTIVASYVDKSKIALTSFNVTRDNVVGLVDKVAELFTIDTKYIDKLTMLDSFDLNYGKTLEEWEQDLNSVEDYDANGADALAPKEPSYRAPYYSYSLGKKVIPTTLRYNDVQRAVHSADQFANITTMITKRLNDSEAIYKYGIKRQLIGDVIDIACGTSAGAHLKIYASATAYSKGDYLYNNTTKKHYSVLKDIKTSDNTDINDLLTNNFVVESTIINEGMSAVTDEATGEAFIEQIKKDVEILSDINQGNSFSGNCLGSSEDGLVLFVKQGITPVLDVKTLAGAFHLDKLAIPSEIVVVKDFGNVSTSVGANAFALLCDKRSLRVHNGYRALRTQENAKGDFMNMFLHLEYTAFISMNTAFKVYTTESF